MLTLYLLTHERELTKASNTGRIVKKCLGDHINIIIWQRKKPDVNLVELINQEKVAMLFPPLPGQSNKIVNDKSGQTPSAVLSAGVKKADLKDFDSFIILDATWQEARKMYKRSAYLQHAIKINLPVEQASTYRKRRNQIEGGLSTAECAIAVLKEKNELGFATQLQKLFDEFNSY